MSEPITLYWSRRPGRFVDRATGKELEFHSSSQASPPKMSVTFMGTVREWYEGLIGAIVGLVQQAGCPRCDDISIFVTGPVLGIIETSIAYRLEPDTDEKKCPALVGYLNGSIKVYDSHLSPHDAVTVISPSGHIGTVKICDMG